jgi:hypothetical protein
METGMLRTMLMLLLVLGVVLALSFQASAANVSLTVSGTGQQASSAGSITIAFGDSAGNAFSETVTYGQYSTPTSIASAFGGAFSRDYMASGLCVHAMGAVIDFHLRGTATFGAPSIANTSTFFVLSPLAWQVVPTITWPTPGPITYGTALTSTQFNATASAPGVSGVQVTVSGSFVYYPASGTKLLPGSDTLIVTFTPSSTTYYTSVTATVSIVINPGSSTLTCWP